MGLDFVKQALSAGDKVVATARNSEQIKNAIGINSSLLCERLDITIPEEADTVIKKAMDVFGRVDILVNNAGISYKGFFEEMTIEQINHQLNVNLTGQLNVTKAVLPIMRKQRSGHVIGISSGAGLSGFAYSSIYAASKFAVEGWLDALRKEVESFGINVTIVNPGFYRTELISEKSMTFASAKYSDYDNAREKQTLWWKSQAGKQPGDPKKLARLLVKIAHLDNPPKRLIAGNDVIKLIESKIEELQNDIQFYKKLDFSLEY
ncbi:MAG TPA: SDR family oxidoreductase [Spirochaetota bacterium]|nr:SDR family oxidoreductase [Spirochaetota bacterium]